MEKRGKMTEKNNIEIRSLEPMFFGTFKDLSFKKGI